MVRYRPPPAYLLRRLHDHRRWLDSTGAIGARIGDDEAAALKFSGLDLEGVDFSLGFLNLAQFENCNLRNTWWVKADLEGSMFANCDLSGARFDQADMHLALVLGSEISTAVFKGVAVENVIWTEAEAIARRRAYELRYRTEREEQRKWPKAVWGRDAAERAERIRQLDEKQQASVRTGRTRETIMKERLSLWLKMRCAALGPQP